jgi:hypothetical protein
VHDDRVLDRRTLTRVVEHDDGDSFAHRLEAEPLGWPRPLRAVGYMRGLGSTPGGAQERIHLHPAPVHYRFAVQVFA